MAEQAGEKKHEATPYRRQKAREEGQVARSQDLGSALILLVAVLLLWWSGPDIGSALAGIMIGSLSQDRYWDFEPASSAGWIAQMAFHSLWALSPLLFGVCLVIVISSWAQAGIVFVPDKLAMDFQRLNPLSGLKRLFDLPNAVRIGFGMLKIALVSTVIAICLWNRWDMIQNAQLLSVRELAGMVWNTLLDISLWVAVLLVVLAILDYIFQRWKYEQDIRMTDEEMREEIKMMNGDPQLIARRRQVQRQLVMNRMHSAVPQADVVITNPTELAVAIQFDMETMAAPIVVAKGAGHVAARIRKIALDSGVPVIERKPLAQALFQSVNIGEMVPSAQYAAVAEVLRYVYQLKGKKIPKAA